MSDIITNPISFEEYDLQIPHKAPTKRPPTFYLPHILNFLNQTATNNKLARLQKQYKYPKEVIPQKEAVVTNDYLTQQLLEKKKQEALAKLTQVQSSNIDDNLALQKQAMDLASQYDDKIAAVNSQSTSDTTKTVNQITNWNKAQAAEGATQHAKVDAVAFNNQLNAETDRLTRNASDRKTFLYDMYTDQSKYNQYADMQDADNYLKALNLEFAKVQGDINAKVQFYTDVANWDQMPAYLQALAEAKWDTDSPVAQFLANHPNPDVRDPQVLQWLITQLTSGTDEVSKRFRIAFQDYVSKIQTDASNKLSQLQTKMNGLYYSVPTEYPTYKKGGSLKEVEKEKAKAEQKKYQYLKEIARKNQKQDELDQKRSSDFHKRSDSTLAKQLGALDKEQLQLLKSIFK